MAQRRRIGPYRLLRELGQGGMGVVHQAVHETLQRQVAIKELLAKSRAEKEDLERFHREGLALAQLRHESVVGIHDLFVARERLYMVLEFVDGFTLKKLLETGPLPWEVVATFGERLCDALDHAHHHAVIHRDLKPANVMVSRQGEVKLMDFGIARDQVLETLTETGVVMGTPAYMPPEVLSGEKAEPRSDLYSLGVLLYECLAGTRPFSGGSPQEMFLSVLKSKPAPLRKKARAPKELIRAVERCMSRDRRHRFATAAEARRAFAAVLEKASVRCDARGRLVSFLRDAGHITETEAMTCIDLNPPEEELRSPPPSLLKFALAVLSLGGLAATWWWATQGASLAAFQGLLR